MSHLPLEAYQDKYGVLAVEEELRQDEDVLDTWFSSWLWPMEVFNGITNPDNEEFKYYYPASVLVTGQDIIFFWVARMIMSGLEFKGAIPFHDVYFTGMVRDKQGRKMSKSLGNSPDLLMLIDKYGADAVRFGIMIAAPAGNDLLFDETSLEQGRNFNNKLWNALKLVRMWDEKIKATGLTSVKQLTPNKEDAGNFAIEWFEQRFIQSKNEISKLFSEYKLSEALKTIYSLIWDDFCSWYLEWIKPGFEQPMNIFFYDKTVEFFDELLQWLHPFMPFITEEIYHQLRQRDQHDDLCIKQLTADDVVDKNILEKGENLRSLLTVGREFRQQQQLKNNEAIVRLILPGQIFSDDKSMFSIIRKQLNCSGIEIVKGSLKNESGILVVPFQRFLIGFESPQHVDDGKRKEELKKELIYFQGFLDALNKKLSNERFVQNAKPDIIALEKKKKSDTEEKIAAIEMTLNR